jgi:hypothetical protein
MECVKVIKMSEETKEEIKTENKTENKEFIGNKRLSKEEVIKLLKKVEENGTLAESMYLLELSSENGQVEYKVLYGKVQTFSHKNDYTNWEYTYIIPLTEVAIVYGKDHKGFRYLHVFTPTWGWKPIKI